MGADFIFSIADITEPLANWESRLGDLNDGQVAQYLEESEGWFSDFYDDFDGTDQELWQTVVEDLNAAFKVAYSGSRELGYLHLDGKKWAITGGMSWGDPPTDAMDYIEHVNDFQHWWSDHFK